MATKCRVFISYAHDSNEHRDFLLKYSNWLITPGGLDCSIDHYVEDSDLPEGWPHWMRTQIREAKYVLVVCSPKYLARYNRDQKEEGKGKGVKFESTLIENDIYQKESLNAKFIPVIANKDHSKCIPDLLQSQSRYDLTDADDKEHLYRRLTNQPMNPKPEIADSTIDLSDKLESEELNLSKQTTSIYESIPEIKKLLDMKPGTKLLQAFFDLTVIRRFRLAEELDLLKNGEKIDGQDSDKLSSSFLERAYNKNLLAELWSKLFDESIDPNPFKNQNK